MHQAPESCAAVLAVFLTALAWAQSNDAPRDDLRDVLQKLNDRVDALEQQHDQDQQRIQALEKQLQRLESHEVERPSGTEPPGGESGTEKAATEPANAEDELEALLGSGSAQPAQAPEARTVLSLGSGSGALQSFNPDISLNGDFLFSYSDDNGGGSDDKFNMRELEIGFSGAVDPYTRADMIVTVAREDGDFTTELEEAYLTFLQLPYNLQARVGKFRAEFGRTNPIHLHAVPWIDYPFVIQRFFGEEGLFGTGAELSWLVPNPWDQYMSLTYELANNDNDALFAGEDAADFTHLFRFKTSHDLSPASTVDLGASLATAPTDDGHGGHRAIVSGVDLTYHWKPQEQGLYRSFLWQSEVLAAHTEAPGGDESSWGMYSAAEYQFARRWKLGIRYDHTELPDHSSHRERGYSSYLTYMQSEFLFWRLGYIYTDRNFRDDGEADVQQVQLQLNWTLGAHPAHKF